jgi:hypothetical protein
MLSFLRFYHLNILKCVSFNAYSTLLNYVNKKQIKVERFCVCAKKNSNRIETLTAYTDLYNLHTYFWSIFQFRIISRDNLLSIFITFKDQDYQSNSNKNKKSSNDNASNNKSSDDNASNNKSGDDNASDKKSGDDNASHNNGSDNNKTNNNSRTDTSHNNNNQEVNDLAGGSRIHGTMTIGSISVIQNTWKITPRRF